MLEFFQRVRLAFDCLLMGLRRTGRTTRMIDDLRPEDTVLFHKIAILNDFKRLCQHQRGFTPRVVYTPIRSGELDLTHLSNGLITGRILFDHVLVEELLWSRIAETEKHLEIIQSLFSRVESKEENFYLRGP